MSRGARRTAAATLLAFAGAWLGSAGTASATMPMQKKAKELGIASVQNCQSCHSEKLPKKGASTLNDRGKWLTTEKDKRKAGEIDVGWLKDYVEKK
jgi:mono/diheme cytochrome c family protein